MSHATRLAPGAATARVGADAPADVLRLVRADAHPVALCGAWAGGGDVIAAEPVAVRAAPGPLAEVLDDDFAGPVDSHEPGQVGSDRSFGGGWIGYLGYSAGGEALPPTGPRALPAWWFGYYDHVLRRDRATGEWYFEALWTPERADALEERFAELDDRAALVLAGGTPATWPRGRTATSSARSASSPARPGTRRRSARRSSTSTRGTSSRPTSPCAPRRTSPATRSTRSARA